MKRNKYLSREFLIPTALILIATVAMFIKICTFTEWAMACGVFYGWFGGNETVKAIKGVKKYVATNQEMAE